MAGRTFQSEVRSVRTSDLEIYGVAKDLDGQNVADSYGQIVQGARDGKLIVAVSQRCPLPGFPGGGESEFHYRLQN